MGFRVNKLKLAGLVVLVLLIVAVVGRLLCVFPSWVPLVGCDKGKNKNKDKFTDAMGEGVVERFMYSRREGALPPQRPALALPGPSPNFGPLVNPLERAVARGEDSPIPGLSVAQRFGPGMYAPDVQIDARCRAACDADPTCAGFAVFDTAVDPERGLSGRGCRTYTNSALYAPEISPTLLATGRVDAAQLQRDGFPEAIGPATIFTKQFV